MLRLKIKKVIVLILISFVFALPALCGYNYGRTRCQILDMYTSARIMAMGNAGVGLANDLNALVYNPAGLAQLQKIQLQATHIFYFVGTRMDSFSYGQRIGKVSEKRPGWGLDYIGIGFKWKYFYAGDTIRDESGEEGKSFDIIYSQYSVGAGCPLTKRLSAGLAVNIVSEEIYTEKDTFAGVDLGGHYKLSAGRRYSTMLRVRGRRVRRVILSEPEGINSVGLVIRNIGSSSLPLKLVLGGAHELTMISGLESAWGSVVDDLIVVWEAFADSKKNYGYKFGLEGEIRGFKARAGFIYTTKPNITFGFGVPEGKWNIDYAFLYHWDLGMTHRVSIGFNF